MPLIIYILGITNFALGTSEFMVAGMLPSLTEVFSVSVAEIGRLISFYALGIVVGGPILTILFLKVRLPNKPILLLLLLFYAAAQSVATFTSSYETMVISRIVTGMAAAALFGVSLSVCVPLVKPEKHAQAFTIVIGGLMISMVLGVPLATFIDYYFGWRASFGLIVVLILFCLVVLALLLPPSEQDSAVSLRSELVSFKKPELWAAYATSCLIIGATFSAFSYLTPIFLEVTGFTMNAIPWLLGGFGAASVIGNFVVGRYADQYTLGVLTVGLSALAISLLLFALFAHVPIVSVILTIVIGSAGISMNPAMTYRIMMIVPLGPLVSTVHTSIINIGLGLGTFLGGLALSAGYGLRAPLWIGLVFAVIGLFSLMPYLYHKRLNQAVS